MLSGSFLMLELIKKLKNTNYKYIFADLLPDSYTVFSVARDSGFLSKLGAQVIFDINDDDDEYRTSRVLIKIK